MLAHGLADDRDSFVLPRLAEELASRAGVASLRFDFRGSGESGGAFKFGNAATADGDPADLEAAVAFLNGLRGEEDGGESERRLFEVVALLGHSKAGSAVVSYAARRRTRRRGDGGEEEEGEEGEGERRDPLFVPLIINVAGRFDHSDPEAITSRFGEDIFERVREMESEGGVPLSWRVAASRPKEETAGSEEEEAKERKETKKKVLEWRLTASDLSDRLDTDMGALCRRLPRATRLLCVHGTGDATVPPSAAERYREAAAGEAAAEEAAAAKTTSSPPPLLFAPRVVMVEGADHNFTERSHADELVDAVVGFISEGLSSPESDGKKGRNRERLREL